MSKFTKSLFKWLKTAFNLPQASNVECLCDGVYIAEVLHKISPEYFDNEWKSKIKSDVSPDNWRLRISNLKKIIDRIVDYYNDVILQPLSPMFVLPDANAIGKDYSGDEIGRLLQLILGCAVNCENKQEHIEVIMGLEEDVQHGVMQAIQELMNTGGRDRDGSMSMTFPDSLNVEQPAFLKDHLRRVQEDLQVANEAKDQLTQKCFEMEKKLRILQEEKDSIALENERLIQHLSENNRNNSKRADEISDESLRDRHLSKLQSRIDTLQEDLIKTETTKDEYRVRIDILEKELMENRLQNEDLQRKAKEARQLKDELDIHKHLSDKAEKYEQTIETYKKKLEEMSDLKRQIKMLQEKNREQLKINMDLEEELKKGASVKVQMDIYKKQIQELQEQVVEQRHRADKVEFEYKMLEEKFEQLSGDTERIKREKVQLKLELEETRRRGSSFNEQSMPVIANELCLNTEMMPTNDLARLQQENSLLRSKVDENREESMLIEKMKARIRELELEHKYANKRVDYLQQQLDGVHLSHSEEAHTNRVIELQDAIKQIENLTVQLNAAEEKIVQLEMEKTKKEEEMSEINEKYKKYVLKAKQAVRALEPISLQSAGPASVNSGVEPSGASFDYLDNVDTLKALLHEKERIISELEEEAEKSRALKEMEERLMTTAVYNLAGSLQRRSACERISRSASMSQSNSGSFLSRQRQATAKRFNNQGMSQSDFFE